MRVNPANFRLPHQPWLLFLGQLLHIHRKSFSKYLCCKIAEPLILGTPGKWFFLHRGAVAFLLYAVIHPVLLQASLYSSKNLRNSSRFDIVGETEWDMFSENHTKDGFLPLFGFFAGVEICACC